MLCIALLEEMEILTIKVYIIMTCLLMKTYFQQIKLRGKKRTFIHYQKENILALVKLDISYLSHGKSKIYF